MENEEKEVVQEESKQDAIVKQVEGLSADEIEELKKKLSALKKEKVKQEEKARVYSDQELLDRFDYLIYNKRKTLKGTIIPFIFITLVILAFIVTWIILGNDSLLYGFGFSFIFFAGILYYIISERKDIRRLEEGKLDPKANMNLILEEKKWYQIEFENMSEEEQKEALEHVRSYSKVFGRYRDKKKKKED